MNDPEPSSRVPHTRLVEGVLFTSSEAVYGFAGNSHFEDGSQGPFLSRYLNACSEVESLLADTTLPAPIRFMLPILVPTVACKVIARLAGQMALPAPLLHTMREQVGDPRGITTLHYIMSSRILALVHAMGVPAAMALVTGGPATALTSLVHAIIERQLSSSAFKSADEAMVEGCDISMLPVSAGQAAVPSTFRPHLTQPPSSPVAGSRVPPSAG
jgi:hypothetical protein